MQSKFPERLKEEADNSIPNEEIWRDMGVKVFLSSLFFPSFLPLTGTKRKEKDISVPAKCFGREGHNTLMATSENTW